MSLSTFHPIVARWFAEALGAPTRAQEQAWAAIRAGQHTLVAAPTGSGKTLAAFLTALDELFQEGLRAPLPDEVRIVYVSPLKALSADIHKNLAEPRRGIRQIAEAMGLEPPRITAAVRTGDTPQAERAAMLRKPPHILVTTPESLYLLLTAERSREMLRTVRTVIVDEVHAVIGTRRGAHLALSLERLQQVAHAPLVRLGLSATQKPIEEVARFLVGTDAVRPNAVRRNRNAVEKHAEGVDRGEAICAIVDEGHRREMDLGLEIPRSPLEAVMSHEIWEDYYERLTALIAAHQTTLVFVNTRRMAERLARHLSERLGEEAVTAHHGSLSKEKRLDAETRLKNGELKALVATASLELGIDIGAVDLVCQIGSPHRIATLLQRVGRSGHRLTATPKGRLFPTSRDDLIECAALLRSVRRGELDLIVSQEAPLDVLAQQIVAESACDDYSEDELFALVRKAWPYRSLARRDFDAVVVMLADGFSTRRGRRAALLHRDEVNARVRGRRGSRLLAIASGGAIPEVADYRVLLEPEDTFIGTLNEDFAIESNAGDIFQLGNASWRVLQIGPGIVRVADAKGAPPSIPFWLGEAPARSDELSRAVSDLREEIDRALRRADTHAANENDWRGPGLEAVVAPAPTTPSPIETTVDTTVESAIEWLIAETGMSRDAAEQAVEYLAEATRALGAMPTQDTLVLERFFDESGGMQLVLHAPFGSRINKAWGLALRKRFCRQFNFELQAAATEDALLLSLGPQHSFPLADVFRYLHPATARDVLVQAFLDAPVFQTRWRWNTTISLAVPRNRGGRKVPPQLQRMLADDLMAAVFPDAAACLENIPGDRQIPDHPLVDQTVRDCLQEAMDFDGLTAVLTRIHQGGLRCVSRDTPEPSPLSHEILNARPYAFLDDAPLEERRTQAIYSRRASEPSGAGDVGALDAAAIDRVRDEAQLDPRDADELHDALLTIGVLTDEDASAAAAAAAGAAAGAVGLPALFEQLAAMRRVARVTVNAAPGASSASTSDKPSTTPSSARAMWNADAAASEPSISAERAATRDAERAVWVAAERLPELLAVHPEASYDPRVVPPASRAARAWTRGEAIVELIRGRLTLVGPTTAGELAVSLAIGADDALSALQMLESEGVVLRGHFTPVDAQSQSRLGSRALFFGGTRERELEWCERGLLARIHRYTLHRLRAEIEPVSPADFMRFLFVWQHVDPSSQLTGPDGLRTIISGLDGFELPAAAWERAVLPARMDRYESSMLDVLCLTGDVGWARLSTASAASAAPASPASSSSPDAPQPPSQQPSPHPSRQPANGPTPLVTPAVARLAGGTPIALFLREHAEAWQTLRFTDDDRDPAACERLLTNNARDVLEILRTRGASFLRELTAVCALEEPDVRHAIAELVAAGLVASDGFAGVRALIHTSREAPATRDRGTSARRLGSATRDRRTDLAGRWSVLPDGLPAHDRLSPRDAAVECQAWALLWRYGVVFRRLLTREANAASWRELTRVYRRLEARGEIRGGRFVSGMSGEQFALPEAVDRLREVRRTDSHGRLIVISAADPLNLAGIVTVGDRVRAVGSSRIVYRDGVPLAALEGDYVRPLAEIAPAIAGEVASTLAGRRVPPVISGYIGRTG
jgi:ATP-dependent Lhr-like helicase